MPLPRAISSFRRIAIPAAFALIAAPVWADDFVATPLSPTASFRTPTPDGLVDDATIEPSALEAVEGGRFLVVAHDKAVPLRLIETATGREVATLTSPQFPAETPKSTKWEAMAQDADGHLYVVGSHSGKTEDEKAQHRSLVRFRLAPGPDGLPAIEGGSAVSWKLDAGLADALRSLGLGDAAVARRKIEGLTIRDSAAPRRRELVIGLREPDDLVRTFVVDLTSPPENGAELAPKPLFAFEPGEVEGVRRQLTSLEYIPAWKGFAVVTATEDDANAFHGNTLWFASDERIAASKGGAIEPVKAWEFEPKLKAEGLCVLPTPATAAPGTVRLGIAYDNDALATKTPGRLQVVDVARRPAR